MVTARLKASVQPVYGTMYWIVFNLKDLKLKDISYKILVQACVAKLQFILALPLY